MSSNGGVGSWRRNVVAVVSAKQENMALALEVMGEAVRSPNLGRTGVDLACNVRLKHVGRARMHH